MFFIKFFIFASFIFCMTTIKQDPRYKYNDNGRIIIPNQNKINNLPEDGGELWNRLIFEKSPYLLQHAANPVDWYPWGKQAFDLAKSTNKPIFLSIGYTTCHWCHVMEHESFEDLEIANLMNDVFINVKVDREERPDIDNVYMEVTQQMTGRGGWPMTVIMTPDKKPFFAGTYFPKKSRPRYNRPGMLEIIPSIKDLWLTKEDSLINSADKLILQIQNNHTVSKNKQLLKKTILQDSFNSFKRRFDSINGGFSGSSNKFPKPHDYSFLSRYYYKTKNPDALMIIEKSLYEMKKGGIYDQIGFGFHRYSTDKKWLVPHFEKMLYDQALIIHAYLDAYHLTQDDFYKETVHQLCEYVLRDMTDKNGGFYSAEDADSEGKEGVFYIWDFNELKEILTKREFEFIAPLLSITEKGNAIVEGQPTNIPHFTKISNDIINKESRQCKEYHRIRKKIFSYREKRVHPQKDDKILTDWNGLMISAFARASFVLDEKKYLKAAKASADFIINNLSDNDGGLFKGYRKGNYKVKGMIEDYAFFIWGLIEIYQASFESSYIVKASQLSDYQIKHFWDEIDKGFYFTSNIEETLFVRSKEIYDGAIPSGNSVSALNFIRLGRILSRFDYDEIAYDIIEAFSSKLNRYSSSSSFLLQAISYIEGPSYEVIIRGELSKNNEFLKEIQTIEQPNKVIIYNNNNSNYFKFLDNYPSGNNNKILVYVCQNFSCQLPTDDIIKIKEMLK